MTFQFNPAVTALITRSIIEYVSGQGGAPETIEDAKEMVDEHILEAYGWFDKTNDYQKAIIRVMVNHIIKEYQLKE